MIKRWSKMIPEEEPQIETPDFSEPNSYLKTPKKNFQLKINPKDFFSFVKNKFILPIIILNLILIILVWVLWHIKMVEFGQIYSPLFTNKFLGNFANFSMPTFGTMISFINFYLARKSFNKEQLASFLLLGSALFIQILALILIKFYVSQGF